MRKTDIVKVEGNKRFVKLSKESTIEQYTSLDTREMKIMCYLISELQERYCTALKQENDDDYYYFNGETLPKTTEGICNFEIKASKLKKETMANISIEEMRIMLMKLKGFTVEKRVKAKSFIYISPLKEVELIYDEDKKEHIIAVELDNSLIRELIDLKNNWLVLYCEETKKMTSKYELGLYIAYMAYKGFEKGYKLEIDDAKEYFKCEKDFETTIFMDKMRKYARTTSNKIKKINGIESEKDLITVESQKSGRTITHIVIKFINSR